MEDQKKEEIARLISRLDDLSKRGIIVNMIISFDYALEGEETEFFACESDQQFKETTMDKLLECYNK